MTWRQAPASRRSCSARRGTRTSAPSSPSIRTVGFPRRPAPPVTTTRLPDQKLLSGAPPMSIMAVPGHVAGELVFEHPHVRVDHYPHQLLEAHRRLPAEPFARLGRVAEQRIDLRRPKVARVDLYV